jgi:HK97 gp10 family phage protein
MAASSMSMRVTKIAAPGVLDESLLKAGVNLGNAIGRRARRLVPKRSWALHDTIRTNAELVKPGVVVTTVTAGGMVNGKLVDYATWVERGTSKQRAQPYLRPALLQSKDRDLKDTRGLTA